MNQKRRDEIIRSMEIRGVQLSDVFEHIKDFFSKEIANEILKYYEMN